MKLEEAVNHNGHNEHNVKTKGYILFANYPLGEAWKLSKSLPFVVPVVSLWFELRF